jgi:hypothetical protein
MSAAAAGQHREFASKPYLLDSDPAHAYNGAIETPPRRSPRTNIHNDDEAARKAGFRAPIAAGEHTYALMANFLYEIFGEKLMRGGSIDAALIKPVFYGDRLTMHARATEESAAHTQFEVWTENDRGERVLAGSARIPKS